MKPPGVPANFVQCAPGEWCHPSLVKGFASQGPTHIAGDEITPSNGTILFTSPKPKSRNRIKPLLNKTEERWKTIMVQRGISCIMEQAFTLRLDPPFKSYTPDLAYIGQSGLTFVEVKGPHRFRRAGIAKAALAAKTFPQFRFELADWVCGQWVESVLGGERINCSQIVCAPLVPGVRLPV